LIEPSRGTDPQAQGKLCTIIICTLAITERGRSLARAIASVRTHNAVVPSVLVVVNGDRYDPTLLATLKARGDIDVLQIPEKSLGAAIAAGRRAVRTPFFGFLDDDDEYLPGAIDVRLALLESNPHAGVAVTNGLRSINGVDEVIMQHINLVTADPLTAVFHEQWLASCSALYRAAVVPAEMFENIARYLEWTWLAFVMASAHTQVVTADVPTFRIFDTENSESKSDAYLIAHIAIFERMLGLTNNQAVRANLKERIRGDWHYRCVVALGRGARLEAWRCHWRSLTCSGGWRYLLFTRYLIPGWPPQK
jgi:glycosyltransferase involved in cell wall biosynthesis